MDLVEMADTNVGYVSLPLLTVGEAAKYLGMGRKLVYQLIEWGVIRAVKQGGAILIEKQSLDTYKLSGRLA
jgi:excisionase family DNA binding protein